MRCLTGQDDEAFAWLDLAKAQHLLPGVEAKIVADRHSCVPVQTQAETRSSSRAAKTSARVMRSAYFLPMSNRLAACGSSARSPTQSETTIGRRPWHIASSTLARTHPLVVQPA